MCFFPKAQTRSYLYHGCSLPPPPTLPNCFPTWDFYLKLCFVCGCWFPSPTRVEGNVCAVYFIRGARQVYPEYNLFSIGQFVINYKTPGTHTGFRPPIQWHGLNLVLLSPLLSPPPPLPGPGGAHLWCGEGTLCGPGLRHAQRGLRMSSGHRCSQLQACATLRWKFFKRHRCVHTICF